MLSKHKSHHCQHRSDDFPAIAGILSPHKPQIVVELGTDRGGFAAFLADLVRPWGGQVYTFDIEAKFLPSLLDEFRNLHFVQADVLAERHPAIVERVVQPGVLLYCDNGNKPREVELYAPLLPVGSLLGVHDYNTEIPADWVEPFVDSLGYEPEGHADMEALRNEWYPEPMSRFWVRRRLP
jgi:cephalosporin hydroxylase